MAQLAGALLYKPEGRGLDSRWCNWLIPSGRTMVLSSTRLLPEISIRKNSWEIMAGA